MSVGGLYLRNAEPPLEAASSLADKGTQPLLTGSFPKPATDPPLL